MNGEKRLKFQLRRLVDLLTIMSVTVVLMVMAVLVIYQKQYSGIMYNVTTASEFNQDFKENIDLKMYYYVIESKYSEGLPIEEVHSAQKLAQALLDTTVHRDSLKAITSVLDLCENLEEKIYLIEATDSYDQRQLQLENNIYVLTSLIQEYMYNYLYSESAQLNLIQNQIYQQITIEVTVLMAMIVLLTLFFRSYTGRLSQSVTEPVANLCQRMEEVSAGDLTPRQPLPSQTQEINTLSIGLEKMVTRIQSLLDESTQKQTSLRKAELALLQAQINPHFLYNTMDTIIWLIEAEKNQEAEEMVANLSSFFRHSLSKGRDMIYLREEEQHVRSYLQIQQVRYKDILQYTIDIPVELHGLQLPKLTLQPLVENALYHGIKLKRGIGHIAVKGWEENGIVMLQVSDDGAGISSERLQELNDCLRSGQRVGFGLVTVHERLQLCYGPGYGLSIESEYGVGTKITVRIPADRKEVEEL